MRSISRSLACVLLPIALLLSANGAEIGPFTGPSADAEAERLSKRANDYVLNVAEGEYSYAYIQFHWKRAGNNVDRILHAYPTSPAAAALKANDAKVGIYSPIYFKERVLPRLEEKKVASFDAVSCAIFLYNLETNTDRTAKKELLSAIIQTLCRQMRWGEALGFPVLDEERAWLWNEVIRQAAIYRNDELVDELMRNIMRERRMELGATVLEARAFRGDSIDELHDYLTTEQIDTPQTRSAIFRGLVRRALPVKFALDQSTPLKGIYDGVDSVQNAEDPLPNLGQYLDSIPDGIFRKLARIDYAKYLAGTGQIDEAKQHLDSSEHAALADDFANYLVKTGQIDRAKNLPRELGLTERATTPFFLNLVESLARDGRDREITSLRTALPLDLAPEIEQRIFVGSMHSTIKPLLVREHSFARLPTNDPNLTGKLICEWSLTPTRNLRGAAPWDAVVFKFAPGFENLPPPKDLKKVEAAGR
jgi:hypothetical protein